MGQYRNDVQKPYAYTVKPYNKYMLILFGQNTNNYFAIAYSFFLNIVNPENIKIVLKQIYI